MPCKIPPELNEEQLLRYLDDSDDQQVAQHLAQCSYCRARAGELSELHDSLSSSLFRVTCPSSMELGEYHLGIAHFAQATSIRNHLASCPHCRSELATLKSFMSQALPEAEMGLLERVNVLVAELVSGQLGAGLAGPLALPTRATGGVRGQSQEPRIYQAGSARVAIEIREQGLPAEGMVLLGLVIGMDLQDVPVHLWQADQLETTTTVDQSGNFVFSNLATGNYELILAGGETEIHIQDIEI